MKYVGPAKDELMKKIVEVAHCKFGPIRPTSAKRYASSLCQLHGLMFSKKYVQGTKKGELVLADEHLGDFLQLHWLFKEMPLKRAFGRHAEGLGAGSQIADVNAILAGMRVAGGEKARKKSQYLRWEEELKQRKGQSELVKLGDCRACQKEADMCACARKDPVPPHSLRALQVLLARRYRMWSGKKVVQETESETDKQKLVKEAEAKVLAAIHSDDEEMGIILSGPDGSVDSKCGSPLQEYVMMNVVEEEDTRLDLATVLLAGSGDATDDPEMNYLLLGPVLRFKVNRCKHDRSYADQQKKIGGDPFRVLTPSARLQRILRDYLRVCRKRPGDYLYMSHAGVHAGEPLCRKAMSAQIIAFFQRKLGTKVTMTDWRKLKPTANHSENRKAMERDAYVSGHSVATQAKSYIDAVPSAVLRQIVGR